MTIKEFKEKLKKYLLENMDTGYDIEEVDEDTLIDLVYEYLSENDNIIDQIYVSVDVKRLNFIIEPGEYSHDNGGKLLGFNKISNLSFCGALAYGDFQIPVFLIMFFDESDNLKVYIPEKGNLFNKFTLEAYEDRGEDLYELGFFFKWGEIQKDIHDKVFDEGGNIVLKFNLPNRKEKGIESHSRGELQIMLDEAVAEEDYLKAAKIKKELDSREI